MIFDVRTTTRAHTQGSREREVAETEAGELRQQLVRVTSQRDAMVAQSAHACQRMLLAEAEAEAAAARAHDGHAHALRLADALGQIDHSACCLDLLLCRLHDAAGLFIVRPPVPL